MCIVADLNLKDTTIYKFKNVYELTFLECRVDECFSFSHIC